MAVPVVTLTPTDGTPLTLEAPTYRFAEAPDWGDAITEVALAEGPEIVGAVPGIRRQVPREVSLPVLIDADTGADYLAAAQALDVAATGLARVGGTLSCRVLFDDGTSSEELELEVLGCSVDADAEWTWRRLGTVVLNLTTQPQWLAVWEEVGETLNSTASLIEVALLTRGNLAGPGRVTLGDDAATARRFAEIGGAFRDYDADAEVEFLAQAFSLTGTDGVLGTNADAIGPGSNNVVLVTPVLPAWRPAAYLLALPHRGSFRVRVRAEFDSDDVTCFTRVVWRSGQGVWKELGTVEVPSGGFYDLDVGALHHYDAAETIELRFDVRASAVEEVRPFRLNLTTITPSEVYALARGLAVAVPSTGVAAYDDARTAETGDLLAARTANLGGSYSSPSGTGDFTRGSSDYGFRREYSDDASLQTGRYTLLGTSTALHTVAFAGQIFYSGAKATDAWLLALIHYVDVSNWAAAGLRIRRRNDGDYEGYVCLYKRVGGGAPTLIEQKHAKNTELSTGSHGKWLTGVVAVAINADGEYEVLTGPHDYGLAAGHLAFSGTDAVFATGGALDNGRIGLLSAMESTSSWATFDAIAAYSDISESTLIDVVRKNGIGQLDHSQAVSAANGLVSPQPVSRYDGHRIWLPPGEGLLTAKVRAGDSETEVDSGAELQTDVLVEQRPAFASLSDALA